MGSVTESGPVGPAFQKITHIVAVGGVLHAGLDRARIGIRHRKSAPVRSADAGGFGLPVAAAPVLIDVIHPHRPLGGLIEGAHRKLTGQYKCQMRRIALYGGVVEVAHIDVFRHRGIEVAAEIIGGAQRQGAFLIQDGVPLHADLPLDARNAVVVGAYRRRVGAVARDRGRGHHERAVDIAPVILRGDTQREVLEKLPADAEFDLRHVALALIDVLRAADVAPYGIGRIVVMGVFCAVAYRTVRREAEAQTELLGQRQLKCDVVEVEGVVGRAFRHAVDLLGVVVILALQPEVEEETLLRRGAESRRIEQIDHARTAHGHTYTAHRTHRQGTGRVLFADAVHRVGRECVNTACLSRCGAGNHHGCNDNQFN